MNETTPAFNIHSLLDIIYTFTKEGISSFKDFLESDEVQDLTETCGEVFSDSVKMLKAIKNVSSIPSKLFMRKYTRYCKGLLDIPFEKRTSYLERLGSEKFNRDGIFILNIIQKIEEEDKLELVLAVLEAKMDGRISDGTFRRLTVLIDRTMYSDIMYLKEHITAEPVALSNEYEYGLQASGLLSATGTAWEELGDEGASDSGMRFNYTRSAKLLASILFHTHCSDEPTNTNINILPTISAEDVVATFG